VAGREARRVLIVEDEFLVAMLLEDFLLNLGHRVVASVARVDAATRLAARAKIDLAILDINLSGVPSFPVAEILRRRGIPFVFATGYGADGLSAEFRNEPALRKPYELRDLRRAIEEALARVSR
jgi:CheY-like chemotaxis protein